MLLGGEQACTCTSCMHFNLVPQELILSCKDHLEIWPSPNPTVDNVRQSLPMGHLVGELIALHKKIKNDLKQNLKHLKMMA